MRFLPWRVAIGDKYNLYFTVELERASVATESMNWSWSCAAASCPPHPLRLSSARRN